MTWAEGRCTCREVRYRMLTAPMFVHCCHCTWCQRETGSAFVLNALIEHDRLELVAGAPEVVLTPSASGRGQPIMRCPTCRIALWSTYSLPTVCFVRVGTLEHPELAPPDVHIFTSTKQPWLVLPPGARVFAQYYAPAKEWPAESLARRAACYAAAGLTPP